MNQDRNIIKPLNYVEPKRPVKGWYAIIHFDNKDYCVPYEGQPTSFRSVVARYFNQEVRQMSKGKEKAKLTYFGTYK